MESSKVETENKYGILPFSGNNFDNWKFRLQSVLRAIDVYEAIEEISEDKKKDKEWIKKDNKAKNVIIQSVSDSHLEYVKDIEYAGEMLDKLESIFAKKGTCSKFYLLKELVSLKYNVQEDLQNHFAKYDKLSRELKSLGANFAESDMACFLLLSMPVEYENVVTAIRTMSEDNLQLETVKKRLLEFKNNKSSGSKIKTNSVPASFVSTKSNIKCHRCGKMGHLQSVCGIKCYICNKLGHKAAHCRSSRKTKENVQANYSHDSPNNVRAKVTISNQAESVAFCSILEEDDRHDNSEYIWWYADSGATHHYINDEGILVNKKYFSEPKPIQLAEKGKFMLATCCGDVKVISTVGNREIPITIENVFCVPDLRVNLLSISRIEEVGFAIIYVAGRICIKKNGILYAQGERKNNLYNLKFKLFKESSNASLAVNLGCELWHRRYGHLNYESLSRITRLNLVNGLNIKNIKNNDLCEVCIKAKQRCLPYYSKTIRSSRVLQLIHTDVCGPITPASHNDNRYFLTFVDDYSRFVMVYVIRSKDEVLHCFKDFEGKVSALFCGKRW